MKKILTTITILISTQIYAQKYDSTSVTDNGKVTIHTSVDSALPSIIEDTTALTFKQVYGDVKAALTGLSEGLKVGVEHVYEILVKQQVVNSIIYTVVFILSIVLMIVCIKSASKPWGEAPSIYNILSIITGIFSFLAFLIAIFNIDVIIMGIINPEYGAIKEILNVIK